MVTTIYIPMAANRKVEKLLARKRDVERELKVIRDNCKHQQKILRLIPHESHPSQVETRWVCEACDLAVGYPSSDELKKFLSN